MNKYEDDYDLEYPIQTPTNDRFKDLLREARKREERNLEIAKRSKLRRDREYVKRRSEDC